MDTSHAAATVVANFWKDFDLEGLKNRLDEQGLAVAENQELSVKSRRKLAETTRDFKRGAPADAVKQWGVLLKSYQEEIDRLTNRAKSAESAFLEVYQKLYEAPDPAPTLAAALETASRSADLEAQVRKMAQELAEFKAESSQLKNQDLTIRRLEERARVLEAQLEDKERQVEEARSTAAAESDARLVEEMAAREAALSAALAEAQASLTNMQRLHELSQKQIFLLQARTEEEQVGMQAELDLATSEIERAQQRLLALEQEKAGLAEGIDRAAGGGGASVGPREQLSRVAEEAVRTELANQRNLVSRLHGEVASLNLKLEENEAAWSARCDGLRRALEAQEAHSAALETELAARPTSRQVEELRQQIRVLQAVGYGSMDIEEAAPTCGGTPREGGSSVGSLENLLLSKARRLEHELTMARLRLSEVAGEAESSAGLVSELQSEKERNLETIRRLEEDLLALEQRGGGGFGIGDSATGSKPIARVASSLSDGLGGGDEKGERTMVSVLCSQRDRFKARVAQLEELLAKASADMAAVRSDLEAARSDNIALVERLKYVQTYQQQGSNSSGAARRRDAEKGDVEGRYQKAYEERINPFGDFRDKEKAARKQKMNVADRVMYEFGQIISGSQAARIFVMVYSAALHVLVFYTLARHSHTQVNNHLGAAELQLLCLRQSTAGPAGALGPASE
eukprot:jgi/Botrbrau1/12571/Bobra.0169s0105.1